MLICANQAQKYHSDSHLQKAVNNIRCAISDEKLIDIFEKVNNGEVILMDIADLLDLDIIGLNFLYKNYLNSLEKPKEKAKPKSKLEDQHYDTNSLIKKLTLFRDIDGNKKLRIDYNGPRGKTEIVEGTKENQNKYQQQVMNDGRNLVSAITSGIKKAGGITKVKMSSNERLLYNKWKLYLSLQDKNTEVKKFAKTIDKEEHDIIKERLITYKKLNSLDYTLKQIKEDAEFIDVYYQNRVEISSNKKVKK